MREDSTISMGLESSFSETIITDSCSWNRLYIPLANDIYLRTVIQKYNSCWNNDYKLSPIEVLSI